MINEDQATAAKWSGAVLLAAPPGSGKTTTLVARMATIKSRCAHDQIIAVSFTRVSADELQVRVAAELGEWANTNVITGTFHSLCKLQLERQYGATVSLIEEVERNHLIMKAARQLNIPLEEEDAVRLVEAQKNAITLGKPAGSVVGEKLTHTYQQLLQQSQLLDFQDLINNALRDMTAGVLKPLPCQHLLLDELQDIDASQIEWAAATARLNGATVFGVGDDDQSIFGFRHAQGQKGMEALAQAVDAKLFVLTHNYRSHQEIVRAATRLIEHNKHRISKRILAAQGVGGGITFCRFADAEHQAAELAGHIENTPGTWGVLARNRHLLLPVQAFLSTRGIEHRSVGRTIWQERAVRTYLIALGIVGILNPRPASKELLFSFVGATEEELDVLRGLNDSAWLLATRNHLPRAIKTRALLSFKERFLAWHEFAKCENTTDLMVDGVGEWIKAHLPGRDKKPSARDHALVTAAQKSLGKMKGDLKRRLLTVTRLDAHKLDARISLTTFHGAKGLEWDYVWLVSTEDSVIPNSKSPIEEERRLFYVAITRARKRLVISARRGVPSSFLHEAFPAHSSDISSGYLHIGNNHGVTLPPPQCHFAHAT